MEPSLPFKYLKNSVIYSRDSAWACAAENWKRFIAPASGKYRLEELRFADFATKQAELRKMTQNKADLSPNSSNSRYKRTWGVVPSPTVPSPYQRRL